MPGGRERAVFVAVAEMEERKEVGEDGLSAG
jgi:hypothetical protein